MLRLRMPHTNQAFIDTESSDAARRSEPHRFQGFLMPPTSRGFSGAEAS